eukprot:11873679-Alexandrium_andersonii.AAC.1
MCSFLCRRWAAIRLKGQEQWVSEWQLPEMLGASKDRGAASAAWTPAMRIECSRARGCDTSALSLDIS